MSLRTRLTLIILAPLLLVSLILGYLAFRDAQSRATARFDRSLLSTTLAILRDTALSGGDALSPETRDLLRDTSGGPVFYHVYAPNGVYVTGYATPPVPPQPGRIAGTSQTYFEAVYQRRPVRALRFVDAMSINGLTGDFTFTVWQDLTLRDSFVRDLSQRTFLIISIIIAALGLIVWFGVRIGLRPLIGLQHDIAQRSSRELRPIQRPVPTEVQGVVHTFNGLLLELETTMRAKDEFISNAAHQLRNPIAGVLAMSEAVRSAGSMKDVKHRSAELVLAAKEASDLADSLLAFERAKSPIPVAALAVLDANAAVSNVLRRIEAEASRQGVSIGTELALDPLWVRADLVLFDQAILNLVRNALIHGGARLTSIHVKTALSGAQATILVCDNGKGIPPDQIETATARFGQISPSGGSGLGLPIAAAIAAAAGGSLSVDSSEDGLAVSIRLPICGGPEAL